MGDLEQPGLLADRAGERAALVTEGSLSSRVSWKAPQLSAT